MPREGVGVALGAQVEHVATYHVSPEGSLIYTVFTKKCQKRTKKGVPLFLTGKSNVSPKGGVYLRRLAEVGFAPPPGCLPRGGSYFGEPPRVNTP